MKNKKQILWAGILLAAILVLTGIYGIYRATAGKGDAGGKTITVQVIHSDGTTNTFPIETDAEYLADALVESEIVEDNQSTYGLYILTADGETANEGNQEWWCITKGGEGLNTGASETPISDGEVYELTFTVGYDF